MFFVPGHPGYQHYLNALHGCAIVVCGCATALFLVELRHDPKDLGRRAITVMLLFATAASALNQPASGHIAAELLGSSDTAQLLAAVLTGIGCSTATVVALSAWQDPPEKQRRTVRLWLAAAAIALAATLVLWSFTLLPKSGVQLLTRIDDAYHLSKYPRVQIHDAVLILATLKIRSLCSRNTDADQRSWAARGIRLVRLATSVEIFFVAAVLAMGAANAVFGSRLSHPETLGMPCAVIAVNLMVVGLCLPAVGPPAAAALRRRADERAYWELEPLWADLADDNPDIALDRNPAGAGIDYLLYRRVVEIRDGLTRLAPHITPPRRDDDCEPGAQAASQIRRALADKRTDDGADRPDGFARLAGDDPAADLETEIHWLRQTAKHYARAQQAADTPEPARSAR